MILARKYRPRKLSEVIGQPTVVQTLSNALVRKKLHHAYLFTGQFGCGKCVSPDTIVWTTQGLKRIKLLVPNEDGIHDIDCQVYDETGIGSALSGYYESNAQTLQIETREGFQIEATPEHPIKVWSDSGLVWKQASEIQVGDWLPIVRNSCDSREDKDIVDIPWEFNFKKYLGKFGNSEFVQCQICGKNYGNLCTHLGTHNISSEEYLIKYPEAYLVSENSRRKNCVKNFPDVKLPSSAPIIFARLCGYILSEGGVSGKRVFVTNADPEVIKDVREAFSLFGIDTKINPDKRTDGTVTMYLERIKIAEAWKNLGFGGNSYKKRVPDFILRCPPNWIKEFIRAYYEGDGGVDGNSVACCSRSLGLIRDIQTILLHNGIISSINTSLKGATNGLNIKKEAHTLRICSQNIKIFAEKFGFISKRKKQKLQELLNKISYPNRDIIPFMREKLIQTRKKLPITKSGCLMKEGKIVAKLKWPTNIKDSSQQNVTYSNLESCFHNFTEALIHLKDSPLFDEVNAMAEEIGNILKHSYFFSPVASIKEGKSDVIDINKDGDDHSFFANGMINHNTSTARILAASENCSATDDVLHPCGGCELCKAVFAGTHTDITEIDAASNAGKVEQIRELKTAASYAPMDGADWKYYIIDEAHRMTAQAEEALLKLLEEPPNRVRFILCTTEHKQM